METILSTSALAKRYGRDWALRGLTLSVPKGAIFGLIGRNGAGKTTLMRLLCGLQSPSDGVYTLFGVPNGDKRIRAARRCMGALVERPAVYSDLTARENLYYQYRMLGLPDCKGADELLSLVGLQNAAGKRAGHFSLGMRQRLGVAVALAGDPDLLLLDEPVNGLDPQGIIDMRELILTLNREKRVTVVLSSHLLDELARVATDYAILDGGRLVRQVSRSELEGQLRRSMRFAVTDTRVLARVLDGMGVSYRVLDDRQVDVFSPVEMTPLTLALSRQNCQVLAAQERVESLEGYFLRLIGGEDRA